MKYSVLIVIALLFCQASMAQSKLFYEPNFNTKSGVGKYAKAEIGVRLPEAINQKVSGFLDTNNGGLNPYDADAVNLYSVWTSPTGKTQKVFGFYYEEFRVKNDQEWQAVNTKYNWLLRWSPDELGEWKVEIFLEADEQKWASNEFKFKCKPSSDKGYLVTKAENSRYFYRKEDNKPFFGIGHSIGNGSFDTANPAHCQNHRKMISEQADNGGTLWRLELGMNSYLPSGFNATNYSEKMPAMWELDRILELSKQKEQYLIAFRHHVEVQTNNVWDVSCWEKNGYRISLDLKTRDEYFTSKEALKWHYNELRYMLARWGYNTSFAFYGYSEVEGWLREWSKEKDVSDLEMMDDFVIFIKEQQNFIESSCGNQRLMPAHTFASTTTARQTARMSEKKRALYDVNLYSAFVGWHRYSESKDSHIEKRPKLVEMLTGFYPDKPLLQEEAGYSLPHLYCATDNDFVNTVWTSLFTGECGTAMHYFWNRGIHHQKMYEIYNAVAKFRNLMSFKDGLEFDYGKNAKTESTNLAYFTSTDTELNIIYGYAFDPSFYWRNMKSQNIKIKEYIENGKMSDPCVLYDGHRLGEPLSNENNFYADPKFEDDFTADADKNPMSNNNYGSETIKIKGLKRTGWFKKKANYLVTYYNPNSKDLKVSKTETVTAKRNGSIYITLDKETWPRAAFIVSSAN